MIMIGNKLIVSKKKFILLFVLKFIFLNFLIDMIDKKIKKNNVNIPICFNKNSTGLIKCLIKPFSSTSALPKA